MNTGFKLNKGTLQDISINKERQDKGRKDNKLEVGTQAK